MLNTLFILIIIGVAIACFCAEIISILDYKKQCKESDKAIKLLKDNQGDRDKGIDLLDNDKMRGWFLHNFVGDIDGNLFVPRYEDYTPVMLSYPSVLGKPVPRGPVYFAPTLLTALGVLGTFAGIYQGLQGVNLDIQETETLLKTSTDLLRGMKFAFLTSLLGLGSSSLLMLLLAGGGWWRQKRRNDLRTELSKVALLQTPGRILAGRERSTGGESNLTAKEIGDAVAKGMQSVLRSELTSIFEPLTKLNPKAIGQAVAEEMRSVLPSEELKPIFESLTKLNSKAIGQAVAEEMRSVLPSELKPIFESLTKLNPKAIGQAVAEEMRSVLPSEELKPIFESLTKLTPEAIGQATGGYLRGALQEELTPALKSMNAELVSIRESQQENGQAVDYLVEQLREELIEPVVKRLDETAQLTKEASEAVKELKTALGGITKDLAGAVETIQKFQTETLKDLKLFAVDLKDILNQFSQDTRGVLVTVADEIKRAVDKSIEGMEAQRKAFKESADQAAATFIGIRAELEKSLQVQAELQKEMLQGVEASTRQVLEDANQAFISQSETLVTIGREASGLMNQAAANLTATLTGIDEMLQKTRITVQEELEQFRIEYQTALNKFFEDQNNLLEGTLRKQREALESVIAQLQKVFLEDAQKMGEAIKESMGSIQQTAKIVYNLAEKTGLTSGDRLKQLEEVIRELGSEANQIETAYQNMGAQFEKTLKIGNEQLMKYLEKANESYIKAIKEGDSAAAEVCNQLNQTSHGLMDVSHYLVASVKELRNGNGSRSE